MAKRIENVQPRSQLRRAKISRATLNPFTPASQPNHLLVPIRNPPVTTLFLLIQYPTNSHLIQPLIPKTNSRYLCLSATLMPPCLQRLTCSRSKTSPYSHVARLTSNRSTVLPRHQLGAHWAHQSKAQHLTNQRTHRCPIQSTNNDSHPYRPELAHPVPHSSPSYNHQFKCSCGRRTTTIDAYRLFWRGTKKHHRRPVGRTIRPVVGVAAVCPMPVDYHLRFVRLPRRGVRVKGLCCRDRNGVCFNPLHRNAVRSYWSLRLW